MQIGAMNNPQRNVFDELRWITALQMEFIDLTLEPPAAAVWQVDLKTLRKALADAGLGIVGHTAFYLPIASSFEGVRRGAVAEIRRCMDAFAELGATWVNLHPDRYTPLHDRTFYIQQDLRSIRELLEYGQQLGVGVMVENVPGDFNNARQLGELLDPLPELGLHLDLGHCNLLVRENTAEELLTAYGSRLRHVHLHDNKGGQHDLHLPLGTGNVDVLRCVRHLKTIGYDRTITLEVFSPDRHYLAYSRDLLRRLWDETA